MKELFDLLKRESTIEELTSILPQDLIELSEVSLDFVKKCISSNMRDICLKRVEVYKGLLRELFKLRTSKSLEKSFSKDNADYEMLMLIQSFLNTISDVIVRGPHMEGKVLCKVTSSFEYGKRRLNKNEYVTMDFIKASILDALGFLKVVRAPDELLQRLR